MRFASRWHPKELRRHWPGIALAVVIALAASYLSTSYGGPQLLYALFFGMAFHFLSKDPACRPGIEFCSKTLLRTGVALLGARITLDQVQGLGAETILLVLSAVLATILLGWLLGGWLKRPAAEGILSGGAVGICGASAALAIAAVLPQTKENEHFTLLTVVGVTTLSTIAMVIYPLLVKFAGLGPEAAGIFLGGTIHDVAQVVGAGYMVSLHTGDVATIVKLMRVACLVPVVVLIAIIFNSRAGSTNIDTPPLVPVFLIVFVLLMIANTLGFVSATNAGWISNASRACLVTAIAALGVKTSFEALSSLGWRPVFMLVVETAWIAGIVMSGILLMA